MSLGTSFISSARFATIAALGLIFFFVILLTKLRFHEGRHVPLPPFYAKIGMFLGLLKIYIGPDKDRPFSSLVEHLGEP